MTVPSDESNDIQTEYARWKFGLSTPQSVVEWATNRLASGSDWPGFVQLAMLTQPTSAEIAPLFANVFGDIAETEPDDLAAARLVAVDISARIVSGEISAIVGATNLEELGSMVPQAEPELRAFHGLASEWYDHVDQSKPYDEAIVAEARTYLAQSAE